MMPTLIARECRLLGTFETSRDVRFLVAIGGKAEVTRTSSNRRD
jgi:hypothetical protein